MSDRVPASEILQNNIDRLIQEKQILNNRLGILNREYNPDLNTRTQRYILSQIEGTRKRTFEIDQDLNKLKYYLSRAKASVNAQIDSLSQSLNNLTVKAKTKSNKYRALEEFINQSSEKMFTTPPTSKKIPTVTRTPVTTSEEADVSISLDPVTTTATFAQSHSIEASNIPSSTPKSVIKPPLLSLPITTESENLPQLTANPLKTTTTITTSIPLQPSLTTQSPKYKFNFPPKLRINRG